MDRAQRGPDGPAEELYGIFINRVRRERPPELLREVRGLTKWVPRPQKMTGSFVRENINSSRKRMDVACLDMLQFHWWDYSNPGYLDALKHLADLKEEGIIKTLALTNFDTEKLQIILENGIPTVSNQVAKILLTYKALLKTQFLVDVDDKAFSFIFLELQSQLLCASKHPFASCFPPTNDTAERHLYMFGSNLQYLFSLHAYGTVMGGLLSEKYLGTNLSIPLALPLLNTPSLQKYKKMVDAWGGWNLFQDLLQTLNKIASKHGVSIPTVAVKYILDQPAVTGSMVGVRLGLSDHIQDTNAVFSLILDDDDKRSIEEISNKGKDLLKVIGDCGDEYRS
ncbi:hypothetical protein ACLOJK_031286 [Asimina triloba]